MPVIDRATGQEELPDRELGRATLKRVQFGEGEPSVHQLSERDETEDQQESREDEPEELKTRVLSLTSSNHVVGAVYYNPETQSLSVLEDTQDSHGFELAVSLMEHIKPEMILVNSRADSKLVDIVMEYCNEHDNITVQICLSQYFSLPNAIRRISTIKILKAAQSSSAFSDTLSSAYDITASRHDSASEFSASIRSGRWGKSLSMGSGKTISDPGEQAKMREAMLRLGCFTSLDAVLAIGSLGALINHLETAKSIAGDQSPISFRSIDTDIASNQHMIINADALSSLSVFDTEDHASLMQSKRNEGLSLYRLLNTCSSYQGRNLFKRWMLRPLISLIEIQNRHDCVSIFSSVENQPVAHKFRKCLKSAGSIHSILNKLTVGDYSNWRCWKDFMNFLAATLEIRDSLMEVRGWKECEIGRKLYEWTKQDAIDELFNTIVDWVNMDASKVENKLVIYQGCDPRLDELNDKLGNMSEVLNRVAEQIQGDIPNCPHNAIGVTLFPQLGYLIGIGKDVTAGLILPDDLNFTFESDDSCYFKSERMKQLDQHLGDVYSEVADRTIELVENLAESVLRTAEILIGVAETLAELDCYLALSAAAINFQLVRPEMTKDNVIAVIKGRHILHETVLPTFVQNDTYIAGGIGKNGEEAMDVDEELPFAIGREKSILLLTGPNGSGKSAYAKQVALIAYMAQIGSFVPAQSATLGIVDKMFTRLQTRESSSKAASAFMIDLSQVSLALRGATSRSLLILDEFGKGTSPNDGAGLLAGVLSHLLEQGDHCPKTIAITHFHDLMLKDTPNFQRGVNRLEMASEYAVGESDDAGDLCFLYRLRPAIDSTSQALVCAARHGLPEDVIRRASTVLKYLDAFEIDKITEVAITEEETQALAEADKLARSFLKWDPEEISMDEESGEVDAMTKLKALLQDAGIEL